MDLTHAKSQLRTSIQDRIARLSATDRAAESRSLCRRIAEALPPEPGVIAGYVPMATEPNIQPLLEELLAKGWQLYLPAFDNALVFRRAENFTNLVESRIKTMDPPPSNPALKPEDLQFAIVPARAYDRSGNRLGRGNGGYDVWIRKQRGANARTKFWGVCFDCQIVNEVPMEEHDERVDKVFTARGMTSA